MNNGEIYKMWRREPNYILKYNDEVVYNSETGDMSKDDQFAGLLKKILMRCDWEGFLVAQTLVRLNKNYTLIWPNN